MSKSGEIRCGRVQRGTSYPSLPGMETIPAWSRGAGNWKSLSPMYYDPNRIIQIIEPLPLRPGFILSPDITYTIGYCYVFENLFQSNKIFRIDLIDASQPISIENLKPSFWERRATVMASKEGIRRALPKAQYGVPISSYYRGVIMDYITSRHCVYAPLYSRLYGNNPMFLDLKRRHLVGENLIIIGPDGGDHIIPLSLEYLEEKINDPSEIFGHEFVLCAMLLGKEYPTE